MPCFLKCNTQISDLEQLKKWITIIVIHRTFYQGKQLILVKQYEHKSYFKK